MPDEPPTPLLLPEPLVLPAPVEDVPDEVLLPADPPMAPLPEPLPLVVPPTPLPLLEPPPPAPAAPEPLPLVVPPMLLPELFPVVSEDLRPPELPLELCPGGVPLREVAFSLLPGVRPPSRDEAQPLLPGELFCVVESLVTSLRDVLPEPAPVLPDDMPPVPLPLVELEPLEPLCA